MRHDPDIAGSLGTVKTSTRAFFTEELNQIVFPDAKTIRKPIIAKPDFGSPNVEVPFESVRIRTFFRAHKDADLELSLSGTYQTRPVSFDPEGVPNGYEETVRITPDGKLKIFDDVVAKKWVVAAEPFRNRGHALVASKAAQIAVLAKNIPQEIARPKLALTKAPELAPSKAHAAITAKQPEVQALFSRARLMLKRAVELARPLLQSPPNVRANNYPVAAP